MRGSLLLLAALCCFCAVLGEQEVFVALKQKNVAAFLHRLEEISDPLHMDYGLRLTKKQVQTFLSPSENEKSELRHFLKQKCEGEVSIRDLGDAFVVKGCEQVHMLEHELIEFVEFPTARRPKHRKKKRADVLDSDGYVAIETMNRLYDIESNDASKVSQGIVTLCFSEGAGDICEQPLIVAGKYLDSLSGIPFTNVSYYVNSSRLVESTGMNEWDLDYQIIQEVAQESTLSYFYANHWMYSVAVVLGDHVDDPVKPTPSVVSISYAWPEKKCLDNHDCSQRNVSAYMSRTNIELAKLGSMGISLVTGSGDQGATQNECGMLTVPLFPASSPYVLTAGGTKVTGSGASLNQANGICQQPDYPCATGSTETPCTYSNAGYTTGGGFSNLFPRPSFQDDFVSAYLNSGTYFPPSSAFNSSSRAYPDVALAGANILIGSSANSIGAVGGTSAATPLLSGLLSLLNQKLAEEGLPSLGWFNPTLYKMGSDAFTDIVEGNNTSSEQGTCNGSKIGFYCAKGFDAVTGRGTPIFSQWTKYVLNFARDARKRREAHNFGK